MRYGGRLNNLVSSPYLLLKGQLQSILGGITGISPPFFCIISSTTFPTESMTLDFELDQLSSVMAYEY